MVAGLNGCTLFALGPRESPGGNAVMLCGTQPTLDLLSVFRVLRAQVAALPTKTLLAVSHFLGRLCSSWRVPLHVLRTSFSGRALFPYLFLLVRVQSWFILLFMAVMVWLLASFAVMAFLWFCSMILVHLSFHMMISMRWVAPWCVLPVFVFALSSGRAMIVDIFRFCGHGMFFLLHISLAIFQMRSHWFSLHSKRMWFMVSTISQFAQIL